jgi:hypothetical protein
MLIEKDLLIVSTTSNTDTVEAHMTHAKNRAEVYVAIDGERDYQDKMWGDGPPGDPRPLSIGEDILLIEEYIARARLEWTKVARPEIQALHMIRKIAGICVRSMENHGAPERDA